MYLGSARITIHLENFRHNLHLLQERHPNLMPVIKADAYGHGIVQVARVLREEGIDHMTVGSVGEGVLLRQEGHTAFLLALLGLVREDDVDLAVQYGITPLVHNRESIDKLVSRGHNLKQTQPMDVAIKFDTGMSRVGFEPEHASELAEFLRTLPQIRPVLMLSHLAGADDPSLDSVTREQARRFQLAADAMRAVFPDIRTSLANTPGLLAWPQFAGDFARPGVSLYGANPLYGTSREKLGEGFLPVMEMTAPVLSVHSLYKGRTVSYGCLFTAPKDMKVAVVGVGYADGYPRALSSKGEVVIRGRRAPVLGRVCMQMCIVDVTGIPDAAPGDTASLLGGNGPNAVHPQEMANWWGTIPYEVFCALGRSMCVTEKNYVNS